MYFAMAIYVIAVVIANATATAFIQLPLFGITAVGTLVFGLTFTQRDKVHEFGKNKAYAMIVLAVVLSIIESFILSVPLRIIAASAIAIALNETADTEVYERLKYRHWLIRIAGSNAVSIPIDTILFTLIAFLGVLETKVIVALIVGDILVKFLMSFVIAPIRYRRLENQIAAKRTE